MACRVQPDPWAWAPWQYATDSGLFDGRWDDQLGQFRTLYTADSLLGCFLELLARFRPSAVVIEGLDEVEDDDGTVRAFGEAAPGAVGFSWLDGRHYGAGVQTGRYCFITNSRTIASRQREYPFGRHGIALVDVDAPLLKDARDRVLTRSIARWLYDLRHDDRRELVDGVDVPVAARGRHPVWAVFERADDTQHSTHITPTGKPARVTDDTPALFEALARHGLHWAEPA